MVRDKKISLNINSKLKDDLMTEAKKMNMTRTAMIEKVLIEFLKERKADFWVDLKKQNY